MRRCFLLLAAAAVAFTACGIDSTRPSLARLVLAPTLDTLFVGDSAAPRAILYLDARGNTAVPAGVQWSSSAPSVVQVNGATGAMFAAGPGFAVISATVSGVTGQALVVATRSLDVAILLDTIYLLPGDTFTVPVSVRKQGGSPPAAWFSAVTPNVFTIDSATGRVSSVGIGGPLPFIVHADSLADTGAVEVVDANSLPTGKAYYTLLGTIIRRARSGAEALNYTRRDGSPTFRTRSFITNSFGQTVEAVVLTVVVPVSDTVTFPINRLTPEHAFDRAAGFDPVCVPIENWGLWSIRTSDGGSLSALSIENGLLRITKVVPAGGGTVVAGRYAFLAQRIDAYDDPFGTLPVRGTFVTPLTTNTSPCVS
jgi:hypothetical protein